MYYIENNNRDAWATIKGFAYQIEVTIWDWLSLKDNQHLLLENGEDIDIITSNAHDSEALFEQVKAYEKSLTLNSESGKEALINFYDHIINHGKQQKNNVKFKFITTQKVGKEKGFTSKVYPKYGVIQIWDTWQKGELSKNLLEELNGEILNFLKNSPPLDLTSDESKRKWSNYKKFIDKSPRRKSTNFPYNINDYLNSIQWNLMSLDLEELKVKNIFKLRELELTSLGQEENIYNALRSYVFSLLSQKGIKQLSKDNIKIAISNISQNSLSISIIDNLLQKLKTLDKKIDTANESLSEIKDSVFKLSNSAKGIDTHKILSLFQQDILNFKPDSALEKLKQVFQEEEFQQQDSKVKANYFYLEGLCLQEQGKFALAADKYIEAYLNDENNIRYIEKAAFAYLIKENKDKSQISRQKEIAFKLASRLLELDKQNPIAKAISYYHKNTPVSDILIDLALIPNKTTTRQIKGYLAHIYFELDEIADGFAKVQELLKEDIESSDIIDFDKDFFYTKDYWLILTNIKFHISANTSIYYNQVNPAIKQNPIFQSAKAVLELIHSKYADTEKWQYWIRYSFQRSYAYFIETGSRVYVQEMLNYYEQMNDIEKEHRAFSMLLGLSHTNQYSTAIKQIKPEYGRSHYLLRYILGTAYVNIGDIETARKVIFPYFEKLDKFADDTLQHLIYYIESCCEKEKIEEKEKIFDWAINTKRLTGEEEIEFITIIINSKKEGANIESTLSALYNFGIKTDNIKYSSLIGTNLYQYKKWKQSNELLKKGLLQDIENLYYEMYINSLINIYEDKAEILLHLQKWRKSGFTPKHKFISTELAILINDVKDIKEAALLTDIGLEYFPKDSGFFFSKILLLHNTRQQQEIKELLDNTILSQFDFHPSLKHKLIRLSMCYDRTDTALDLSYNIAADINNIIDRWEYYKLYLHIYNNKQLNQLRKNIFPIPKSLGENTWGICKIEGQSDLYIGKASYSIRKKNPIINVIWGKEKGDIIEFEDPNGNKNSLEIVDVTDKYGALFTIISLEIQKPSAIFYPVTKFSLDEQKDYLEQFGEQFGAEQDSYAKQFLQLHAEYKTFALTFTELFILSGNSFFHFFINLTRLNQLVSIPLHRFNQINIKQGTKYVLDIVSVIFLFRVEKEFGYQFQDKFLISPFVRKIILEEWTKQKYSGTSGLRILPSKDNATTIINVGEEQFQSVLNSFEEMITWIDNNCEIVPCYSKLKNFSDLDSKSHTTYQHYIIDSTFINEQGVILVTDDALFYRGLDTPTNRISLEFYLKTIVILPNRQIDQLSEFLLKHGFSGVNISFQLLLNQWSLSVQNAPNLYLQCLISLSICNDSTNLSSIISLAKQIAISPILMYGDKVLQIELLLKETFGIFQSDYLLRWTNEDFQNLLFVIVTKVFSNNPKWEREIYTIIFKCFYKKNDIFSNNIQTIIKYLKLTRYSIL